MTPEIEAKLKACPNLPSPPAIAVKILKLANEPEINIKSLTKVLNCDPALASRILKTANSPLYPYSKKVENLPQAVMILGLNAVIALALSFSLTKSFKKLPGPGLDYSLFWKRALIAGTASRILGKASGLQDLEALYLASLVQDIGMLALNQIYPDLYTKESLDQTCHDQLLRREREVLDIYHAEVGSWLLEYWGFPTHFSLATAYSDEPSLIPKQDEQTAFLNCVALSGKIAEIFIRDSTGDFVNALNQEFQRCLPLKEKVEFINVLQDVQDLIPEIEELFDIQIQTWDYPDAIVEQARETLLQRSLKTLKKVDELQVNNAAMEDQFERFKEKHKQDSLTGVLIRAYLDEYLKLSFEKAMANGESLSIVFCDLDKFKNVNDTYGHQAGDAILQSTAKVLVSKIRGYDMVGRYGGDEFVLILPRASTSAAKMVCGRIVEGFCDSKFSNLEDPNLRVTISLGIATHSPENPYSSVSHLLQDADKAVYHSKTHDGNQCTHYEAMKTEQPV